VPEFQKSVIPKTGGKSILESFYKLGIHDGFGHASIAFYKSVFTCELFEKFFKFAFVRIAMWLREFFYEHLSSFG
jgi:hypothetical protein